MAHRRRLQEILDTLLDEFPPPPPAKKSTPWSDQETSLLVSRYLEGLTDEQLAKVMGRKIDEVQDRLFELGRGRAVPDHLRPPNWWFNHPWRRLSPEDEEARYRANLSLFLWKEQLDDLFQDVGRLRQPIHDRVVKRRSDHPTRHWYWGEIDAIPDLEPPKQMTEAELEAQDALYRTEEEQREARRSQRRWIEMAPDNPMHETDDPEEE